MYSLTKFFTCLTLLTVFTSTSLLSLWAGGTFTWNGGVDNWNESTAWTPNGVPGSSDNAIINNGTVTLTGDVEIVDILLSGGTLTGSGTLTVTGEMTWTGGIMSGSDTTKINPGAELGISGNSNKELNQRVLDNAGTATWSGNGEIDMRNLAEFRNRAGASFTIQNNSRIDFNSPNGGSINNLGTFTKSGGTSVTLIDVAFSNTGTVNVNSGLLRLRNGSNATGALFNIAAGATLEFEKETHTLDNVTFSGSGTAKITSANFNVNGAGLTVNSPLTLTMEGSGNTLGGNGPVTIDGTLNWRRGTITGAAAFTVNGSLNINTDNSKDLNGRTLTNNGAATWTGASIQLTNNAVLDNQGGATLDIQNDAAIIFLNPTGGSFTNSGTVTKSAGAGITNFDVSFTNSGTLNVNSGTVSLTRGSLSNGGTFNTASGGMLDFNGNTHNLNNITLDCSGSLQISSDSLILSGSGVSIPATGNLVLSGGILRADAPVTVNGTFTWSSGTLTGSGAFTVNDTLDITNGSNKILDGKTLSNAGTAAWSGNGDFKLDNGAVISNLLGATFDIQTDSDIELLSPGGSVNNAGTLKKSSGLLITSIQGNFVNTGTVNAETGTLRFTGGSSASSGAFNIAAGAFVEFHDHIYNLNNATFDGDGTLQFDAAEMNISGAGMIVDTTVTLVMSGFGCEINGDGPVTIHGTLNWTRGKISGSGAFTLNGPCAISSGEVKTLDGRTLTNNDTITWSGTGSFRLTNDALFENQAGAAFDIQTDASIDKLNPIGGSINNAGLVTKYTGAGITVIGVDLFNSGILETETGTLDFTETLVNDTTGTIRGSGTLDISHAIFSNYGNFNPGASPGILGVSGNYVQTDTAALNIELGGLTVGSEYDRLVVSGSAQLNGALNISLINGFAPNPGDQFEVLQFSSRSGNFITVQTSGFGPGIAIDTTYTSNSLLVTIIPVALANMKIWLEGPYTGAAMQTALKSDSLLPQTQPYGGMPWNYSGTESVTAIPGGVVDWVLVELRSDTTAISKVASRAGWLKSDGTIVDIDGSTPLGFKETPYGNYYIVVHHRNHLSIMTAAAQSLNGASPVYDFTTGQSQAYGTNAMTDIGSGVFGMIAGDGDSNGSVGSPDRDSVWRPQNGTTWDYGKLGDFDLDGGIDASDINLLWRPNEGKMTRVPLTVIPKNDGSVNPKKPVVAER